MSVNRRSWCSRDVDKNFFFFKQKTAYEMRISDWSSDVCSSDLGTPRKLSETDRRTLARYFAGAGRAAAAGAPAWPVAERKGVVSGKSVSVSVDLGGRRID